MKVCGFSFIRNGVLYDYPFEEAIRSILPLCDEVIVAVGRSEDETLEKVKAISPKIKILETVWDETALKGGRNLAIETDKAFQSIPAEYDWAFYIQGDEVVHEKDYPAIREAMEKYMHDPEVDGLLFNYHHFFGSYDHIATQYSWYRREVRIIRNNKIFYSNRDAQGFKKPPGKTKLLVKPLDAFIYHYGWVRDPVAMQQKIKANIHVHKGDKIEDHVNEMNKKVHDYTADRQPVKKFKGSHPALMKERIQSMHWEYQPDTSLKYASAKDWIKRTIFRFTRWYPGEFKNYKII
ncbi:MAG TPA: glycosyltransferase family 2 protein [Chitinophagaceae bacterium]|nr:glycosyltransferase family 2 protein [Chitinophagaceae bacterium]